MAVPAVSNPVSAAGNSSTVPLLWDIALNATIPATCYYATKAWFSRSELIALLAATAFPVAKSVFDLARRRELNPVSVLILLGILTSIGALSISGDARVLLMRESLFTGALGLACFISLLFPRPMMFYFGRYFMAGNDPGKRKLFEQSWQHPIARSGLRLITTVWGVVYVGEFGVRTVFVYALPAVVVLSVTPVLLGSATILTILWTFRYARKLRQRTVP